MITYFMEQARTSQVITHSTINFKGYKIDMDFKGGPLSDVTLSPVGSRGGPRRK